MTMFGKEASAPARAEQRGAAVAEAPMSIISSGMKITGDLECAGVVKIDGQVDGHRAPLIYASDSMMRSAFDQIVDAAQAALMPQGCFRSGSDGR